MWNMESKDIYRGAICDFDGGDGVHDVAECFVDVLSQLDCNHCYIGIGVTRVRLYTSVAPLYL